MEALSVWMENGLSDEGSQKQYQLLSDELIGN